MSERICVEVDWVFYESCASAGRAIGCHDITVKNRCLTNDWPNYQIVPFRVTYTEKKCTRCKKLKHLSEFHVCLKNKDGVKWKCKQCCVIDAREYYQNNIEKTNKRSKEYREKNINSLKAHSQKPEVKTKRNKRRKEKRETNIAYKINENMRAQMWTSLKGMKNGAPWETLVDYDCEKFIKHLESLFTKDMTWDNYGWGKYKWNLEHRKPKKDFNITSTECQGFRDYWALPNLQPMWQLQNFRKGTKPMEQKYLIKPF